MTNGPASIILSILMLATILLGWGGIWLLVKGRDRKRAVLMLVAAVVMLVNVLIWAVPVAAQTPLPKDVAGFISKRDACDHWRGEPAYDEKRDAQIGRAVRETCTGTDRRLAVLRAKYAADAAVMSALAGYEAAIE